uniref:vWA domain-containing protein n=1 Tax=Parerythrobacter lutipelagi TaxID=1964208 RepID=UPI0013761B2B|nr:VWA domain-containing protein [Parerythrobacter lutipelagi]
MIRSEIPKRILSVAVVLGLAGSAMPLIAQNAQDDEEQADSLVVVTGARIRQGGAQDIKQFRSVSLNGDFLPKPDTLTMEGLLGEYDLTLPVQSGCEQTFCVSSHVMSASLPLRAEDTHFVGLGFASNVDADLLQQEPLSLVAVVDRSGSMSGEPIARLREGLLEALSKLRDTDRFGMVSFETDTKIEMPVVDIGPNRAILERAIRSLESAGSTNMEAGLKLGYDLALTERADTERKTRIMLLTDELPNVGNTAPEGFMGMAVAGSRQGVGMTTIGVGIQFDNALALKISSVRGGNLFYLADEGDGADLFEREFFNMVTEVAHDVAITLKPTDGYKINAVFGVPNELLTDLGDGAISVTIGSAFLSENGGGIFATLDRDTQRKFLPPAQREAGEPLVTASITYTDGISGAKGSDRSVAAPTDRAVPRQLAMAHALVDEYLTLHDALGAYHTRNDRTYAYRQINALNQRLSVSGLEELQKERELVSGLSRRSAVLAGVSGEIPKDLKPMAVVGKWEVASQRGLRDLARGDIVEITSDNELITYRQRGSQAGTQIEQTFQINENQLLIDYTDLVFQYQIKGDRLRMNTRGNEQRLVLRRKGS